MKPKYLYYLMTAWEGGRADLNVYPEGQTQGAWTALSGTFWPNRWKMQASGAIDHNEMLQRVADGRAVKISRCRAKREFTKAFPNIPFKEPT